jgi:tRNA-Thr(GGU) m(6)t(6)A37 methyltransferase TsaA
MEKVTDPIILYPIGFVKNGVKQPPKKPDWQMDTVSQLIIEPKWVDGLVGLEAFSHIIVLFWLNKIPENEVLLKVHPMHRLDLPETGLFATRTPNRPNRIGETVVKLLERQGNILKVIGLDALDDTPVLDIKPYLTSGDFIPTATEPSWTKETHG